MKELQIIMKSALILVGFIPLQLLIKIAMICTTMCHIVNSTASPSNNAASQVASSK